MSDLLEIDGKCELPLPFCTTRFLENIEPTKRLIQIHKFIQTYVDKYYPKDKPSRRERVGENGKKMIRGSEDPLMLLKLNFFLDVMKSHEYLLRIYQQEGSLVPMMTEHVKDLLLTNLKFVMRSKPLSKLNTIEQMFKAVPGSDTDLPVGEIHFNFTINCLLTELTDQKVITKSQVKDFRRDCQQFVWKYI